MSEFAYPTMVYVHLLLFVLWLGADAGVFVLGQHFRKRNRYTLDQRLALLRLLVEVDMVPRSAWALMVPVSLTVVHLGQWWVLPGWALVLAWTIGAFWLWLVWDAHLHDMTERARRDRRIEFGLKIALAVFYFGLGTLSLTQGGPLPTAWLGIKAFLFGVIFLAAILIDVAFKPVGPLLMTLVKEGSSDATEVPLLRTMNRTRIWVWTVYALLLATSYIGLVKPF
jgi:hypothetical protein